jgi:hypothetical protein
MTDERPARRRGDDGRTDLDEAPRQPSSEPRSLEGGGFGPSEIPDPMPAALQERRDQTDAVDAMEGESPSG